MCSEYLSVRVRVQSHPVNGGLQPLHTMEGEIFAENILGDKMPSTAHQDSFGGKPLNHVHVVKDHSTMTREKIRKPWEQVHFDPTLKPRDYHMEGDYFS